MTAVSFNLLLFPPAARPGWRFSATATWTLVCHDAPGLTTGSIEGDGDVFLGANNLTVGTNNLGTTFSGLIQDGGTNGGTGGSLTKAGTGKLTLTKSNTYTGDTTITDGTLQVTNTSGSATGTGSVQVNAGTLGGTGIISGAVTVATATSASNLIAGECDHTGHPNHAEHAFFQCSGDLPICNEQ